MDKFYIAPYDQTSGLETDVKPFLLPDDAFSELTNAYVFRGRVRKRFGTKYLDNSSSQLTSRLRVGIGNTGASPSTHSLPAGANQLAEGQLFSIGSDVFTVTAVGGPAVALLSTNAAITATLNDTVNPNTVTFTGAGVGTTVYWYPALPVMGLLTYDSANKNNETTVAFDTKFAYQYNGGWDRLDTETTAGAAEWEGSNSQFFWGTTWTGSTAAERILFVTNFNANETNFMRKLEAGAWDDFRPQITTTPTYLIGARLLAVFKNRLIAINTNEGAAAPGTNFSNRLRWAAVGSPLATNAWRQDIAGQGSALDCPTTEAAVTLEFIKDRLIVYFERSTWEVVYTGNQAYPFAWQQINTELGAESTFSVVPFDKVALGVGNVGIHACNGINVERVDQKVPNEVFKIHNENSGIDRVYGIRDYFTELVYWSFPATDASSTRPFPNRVLIFNYQNGTWAFNEDSITAFGYFQPQTGVTWDSTTVTWDDPVSWDSGQNQAESRQIIGGNQQGYTFICDAEESQSTGLMQITNMSVSSNGLTVTVTAYNNNLRAGEYVYLTGITSTGGAYDALNNAVFQVSVSLSDADTFTFTVSTALSTTANLYLGGGIISRVPNIKIRTKQYNFYADKGRNIFIPKVEFLVDRSDLGEIQVLFLPSSSGVVENNNSIAAGSTPGLVGNNTLETFPYTSYYPYEAAADRLWRPVYFSAEGNVVQFYFAMSDQQLRDVTEVTDGVFSGPAFEDFQLHAMCIYAMPTSYRMQ